MRRLSAACLALASLLGAGAIWGDTLAITHINVIDATGTPPQPDMTVIVENGRIAEVGPTAAVRPPPEAKLVDGSDKYLIPGLWDMHVHEVFGDWLPRDEKVVLPLFVANGITGVRDMGGDLDVLKEWRAATASGRLLGPRMIIAGPMLDGPVPRFPSSAPVANAADARRVVDVLTARGVDSSKSSRSFRATGTSLRRMRRRSWESCSWVMCRTRCAPRRPPTRGRKASSTSPASSRAARPSRIN